MAYRIRKVKNGRGKFRIKYRQSGISELRRSPELKAMLQELVQDTAKRANEDAKAWYAKRGSKGNKVRYRKQPYRWQVSAATRGSSRGLRGAVIAQTRVGIYAESEKAILTKAFARTKLEG